MYLSCNHSAQGGEASRMANFDNGLGSINVIKNEVLDALIVIPSIFICAPSANHSVDCTSYIYKQIWNVYSNPKIVILQTLSEAIIVMFIILNHLIFILNTQWTLII